ncbi:hypothetical protein [Hydrogenophaga atypica]|uniref:Core-binding (CB) domain-containing protein n=1 Tax=Hydrogenophaga atypica TaxID=249409 RepID=A0ABW2QE31_9BURK
METLDPIKIDIDVAVKKKDTSAQIDKARALYLYQRAGTYYFKRKYPTAYVRARSDLSQRGVQIWKTLDTSDTETALIRLQYENQKFEEDVARVLAKPRRTDALRRLSEPESTHYLLPEHIPHILQRYEYGILSTDDDYRKELSREERRAEIVYLKEWIEEFRECCAVEDFSPVEDIAVELLKCEGLVAPPGSTVRQLLLWELLKKDLELAEAQLGRMQGQMYKTPAQLPLAPRELPTMMTLYQSWAKTQKEVRTRDSYLRPVEEFEALCRPLPVVAIDHYQHAQRYRDHLSASQLKRDTVRNRIGALATIVRYGMREGMVRLTSNPFEGVNLEMVRETPAHEQRRSFTSGELQVIFDSPLYTRGEKASGQSVEVAYWGPLLGIFAGLRIEELCQLKAEDVYQVNGEWALRISNLDPDQHLKASASHRLVPVHTELISCGFIDHVQTQRKNGHERIFPSLRNDNKYERYANAYGKWHSRFLDRLDLVDGELCYHSYRFNFKQQLGICGVNDEVKDALSGHWLDKGVSGRSYMRTGQRQYPFPILLNAMRNLRYDDINIDHLRIAAV